LFNGESRTGPLSYLVDGVTAIGFAYRKIDDVKGETLDRKNNFDLKFQWPRKLWRQMVFLDKDRLGAYFSREYPSTFPHYGRACRGLAAQVLSQYGNVEYKWKIKSYINGLRSDSEDDPASGEQDMNLGSNNYHYKDSPTVAIRMTSGKYPRITPGLRTIPCVGCGKMRDDTNRGTLHCRECDPRNRCATCGKHMNPERESIFTDERGRRHCKECWELTYCKCSHCGGWRLKEASTAVEGFGTVCQNCLEHYFVKCAHCKKWHKSGSVQPIATGALYCGNCVKNHTFKCTQCGKIYPMASEHIETSDGHVFCKGCNPELHECSGCKAKFRYGYSMIDGMCGKCINEKMLKEMQTAGEEMRSA
jgi:hypothetical protein